MLLLFFYLIHTNRGAGYSAEIFIVNKFLWPMAKVMVCHVKGFLNNIHGCTGVTCTDNCQCVNS